MSFMVDTIRITLKKYMRYIYLIYSHSFMFNYPLLFVYLKIIFSVTSVNIDLQDLMVGSTVFFESFNTMLVVVESKPPCCLVIHGQK